MIVVLQAHGVFAITAIGRTAAWLNIGSIPAFRTYGAQECSRVESASTYFKIKRLDDDAALIGPELLQGQDEPLKG